MGRRAERVGGGGDGAAAPVGGVEEAGRPGSRPNLAGDLDELLGSEPIFRVRLHGYDRLEVDNYAAWAERELTALRRQVDHLLARYGEASAELEISRRLLADSPRGREPFPVSERVEEMLRLAADEAAALTEAGAKEADRILAESRTEADALLRKAHQIKESAVASADELLEYARRERAEASALLAQARSDAADVLRSAAEEQERLGEVAALEREREAAAAAAHLADVQAEVDDLRRQRDEARESLRRLTDQIGQALQAVNATVADQQVVGDMIAAARPEAVAS
jgi:cell division septum initiation protein DivIVA